MTLFEKVLAAITVVMVLGMGVIVYDIVRAYVRSGISGSYLTDKYEPLDTYLAGATPELPSNARFAGVVIREELQLQPRFTRGGRGWWSAVLATKNGVRLAVNVSDDPVAIADRVNKGDYVAVVASRDPLDAIIVPENIIVLEAGAVPNLPDETE